MVEKYGRSIIEHQKLIPAYYENVEGVELPRTLDPKVVSEGATKAYEVAKEFPMLLAQIPCYCACGMEKGSRKAHNSLLDCFINRHGQNCQLCINETIFAKDKKDQGTKPEAIGRAVIEKWG